MSTKQTAPKRKLTRAERKEIAAAIERAKQADKNKKSAQQSIPYERMWPDGVCRVTGSFYTKTVQFQDINYQLSQNEDKSAIFDAWCDFLNYFDSSIRFQFSFLNLAASMESFEQSIFIPLKNDAFDSIRAEYAEMLKSQLAKGNNGLTKTKFLTFGIEADSVKAAKPRLERIENDILNNFKRLGVSAVSLNGLERLRLMHSVFHMDDQSRFQFSWDWLVPSGLSTRDFIAPTSFEFKDGRFFRIYYDIRDKLIAKGIPETEIAFIHDANTEARKKELFAKVRSGQVRVLMGSTFKMGAGMNVQDRLIALHDLDCPWRPGDLEQRKGRIVRQGNKNKTVHIYRYVTEGTFDSYLWQTVENKQKFISQIMTSKSPVRSCEDIDETALSYAEIKALCAGDPRIKEKMDLDIEVSRLKLLKANHQSQQYRLEDSLLKYFPEQIEQNKGFITGLEQDMETLAAHQPPEGEFAGMVIRGDTLTDKDNTGAAILEACKELKSGDTMEIGSYRGLNMSLSFNGFRVDLILKGAMTHQTELGTDARGNLTRIDHALEAVPDRLKSVQAQLDNLYQQQAAAKAELGKPFLQETELQEKSARLAQLNALLDIDTKCPVPQVSKRQAKAERPSVLDKLKSSSPPVRTMPDKAHKKETEVR